MAIMKPVHVGHYLGESIMFELIKKTLLTGVGMAVMTKDKVEELGKDLASQARLSENEGKEFIDHLVKQSENARKEFETRVSAAVQKAVSGLNLASKDEVARLSAKVDELAAKLDGGGRGTSA
jgi:polyhydroxyalkanoate synthesis regulator phasin